MQKVFDIMNDHNFMNLCMHHMFSMFHSGKANLGYDTYWVSNLISSDMRSKGFSMVGVSFWELMTETWFRIDKMNILTKCIPLQSVAKGLLNWNLTMKRFLSWISALSSLER